MGSWNQTCGISNLPITYETEVVGLFTSRNFSTPITTMFRPSAVWAPIFLPIFGKYNDYGDITDIIEDWNTNYILRKLKEYMVETDIEDDDDVSKKHRSPITAVDLTFDKIQTYHHQEKLQLYLPQFRGQRYQSEPTDICIIQIHKRIWDRLLSCPIDTGWGKNRLSTVDDRKNRLSAVLNGSFADHEEDPKVRAALRRIKRVSFREELRMISEFPSDTLADYFSKDDLQLDAVCHRTAELMHISCHMDALRKHWSPQNGGGSQSEEYVSYRHLFDEAEKIIKDREEYFDE